MKSYSRCLCDQLWGGCGSGETRGEGAGGSPAPETGEIIKLSSAKHCGVLGLGRDKNTERKNKKAEPTWSES